MKICPPHEVADLFSLGCGYGAAWIALGACETIQLGVDRAMSSKAGISTSALPRLSFRPGWAPHSCALFAINGVWLAEWRRFGGACDNLK